MIALRELVQLYQRHRRKAEFVSAMVCTDFVHVAVGSTSKLKARAVSEALEQSGGADVIRGAVRAWATSMRKALSDDPASVPLDPPSQSRTPRAAALISGEASL